MATLARQGRATPRSWQIPRARRARISEPGLLVLMGIVAVVDSATAIVRHGNFQSGFDLGIFDQAVWHYSHFAAPFSSLKGLNILGDHFSPLVALLSPLYWIWSDPRSLLVAQALLVAASIAPVFYFARSRLGRGPAYLLATGYAAFWGLQVGTLFDFHEVAFAPLLIGLAILLADRQRWGWFWLVIGLLLLVKEDMSFFVVAFGVYLLTRREPRHGIGLIAAGVAWYGLATKVLIPHFGHGQAYAYWSYWQLGRTPLGALETLITHPWKLFTVGFSPGEKSQTMAALFGAFLFLSLPTRLAILLLPWLAERFLSTNSNLWTTHAHYSLAIAPVLAMSAAAGLANLSGRLGARRARVLIWGGAGAILAANLAITETVTRDSGLAELTRPSFYRVPSGTAATRGALAHIPSGASVITVATVLPHLSDRPGVQLINPKSAGAGNYLLANVVRVDCCYQLGNTDYHQMGGVIDQQLPGLTPVYFRDGWLVARRPPPGQPATSGVLAPLSADRASGLERAARGWQAAYASALARFADCTPGWLRRDPSAPLCYQAGVLRLEESQRGLTAALSEAATHLRGGCHGLADVAQSSTLKLEADLQEVAVASGTWSSRVLEQAGQRYQTDHSLLDLDHMLERFLILCTPRG